MSCDPCRRTLKKKVMKNGLSGLAGKKTMKKKMNLWMRPSMRRLCTSCLALLAVCFVHASNMCKHIYTYMYHQEEEKPCEADDEPEPESDDVEIISVAWLD